MLYAAVLSVDFNYTLPVDRFVRIHIAAVLETGMHFDYLIETPLANPPDQLLAGRVVREFTCAAHQNLLVFPDRLQNLVVGRFVNTKRFSPQKVLPGVDDIAVNLRVQIVRQIKEQIIAGKL